MGLEISWMGRGGQVGQVAAFEGKFLCFAHSLAFMATFPIGALPQLLKEGKKNSCPTAERAKISK